MPFYKFICDECGLSEEKNLTMSEKNDAQTCKCGGGMTKQFPDSFPKVNLKGYNWSGKAIKENGFRKKRQKQMREKTKNHVMPGSLTPNYQGNVCGSWEEAATLAKSDGANTSQMEKKIKQEK